MIISSYLKLPKSTNLIITVLPPSVYGISHNVERVREVASGGHQLGQNHLHGGVAIWARGERLSPRSCELVCYASAKRRASGWGEVPPRAQSTRIVVNSARSVFLCCGDTAGKSWASAVDSQLFEAMETNISTFRFFFSSWSCS